MFPLVEAYFRRIRGAVTSVVRPSWSQVPLHGGCFQGGTISSRVSGDRRPDALTVRFFLEISPGGVAASAGLARVTFPCLRDQHARA